MSEASPDLTQIRKLATGPRPRRRARPRSSASSGGPKFPQLFCSVTVTWRNPLEDDDDEHENEGDFSTSVFRFKVELRSRDAEHTPPVLSKKAAASSPLQKGVSQQFLTEMG